LTQHGIAHDYEKTISVHGHPIKYDWHFKESKTYVEYWGFWGRAYMRRKQEKIRLYKEGNLDLISIEDKDLENIYKRLPPKFAPFTKSRPSQDNGSKFCPHCGEALDKRFH
jgi:predicted nuclease of restriction endonuclease-like RecB superfamily